jgi:hypothetical protein
MSNTWRQLCRVKEQYIELSEKVKRSVAILERKVIRETYDCTEDKFENIGAGRKEHQKHCVGLLFKTAVKIISSVKSEIVKPRSRE